MLTPFRGPRLPSRQRGMSLCTPPHSCRAHCCMHQKYFCGVVVAVAVVAAVIPSILDAVLHHLV